jgi:hypothetical protein
MSVRPDATSPLLRLDVAVKGVTHAHEGLRVNVGRSGRLGRIGSVVLPDHVAVRYRCRLEWLRVPRSLYIQATENMAVGTDARLRGRVYRLLVVLIPRRKIDLLRLPCSGVRGMCQCSVDHPSSVIRLMTVELWSVRTSCSRTLILRERWGRGRPRLSGMVLYMKVRRRGLRLCMIRLVRLCA